jgi:phosphopantothenate-cysteine ligase
MNVVVSGGGTVAPIDDVRHITNASTGRFSSEITEACLARGARVWHIHAPSAQTPFARRAGLDLEAPDLAAELRRLESIHHAYQKIRHRLHLLPLATGTVSEYAECLGGLLRTQPIDVAFLAIAASDFVPEPVAGKLDSDRESLLIRCRQAPKVIRSVRDWAPGIFLVGFKLLSGASESELVRAAQRACLVNRADLTVANDLVPLRAGRHTVHLVRPDGTAETIGPGGDVAGRLVDRTFKLARARKRPGG